ncbi:MAG: retron system putative HNH endonuclease [Methanosarcinaceae archaeon]
MKHIVKDQNTPLFAKWMALANDDWQPTYEDLRGAEKKEVKSSLMNEKGKICCYCERRLADEDSHIEHFKPQSKEDSNPLDYTNMLCSCQNQLKKGVPKHCGHSKADWFDKDNLISPLNPDCEGCFAYTADGKIHPVNKFDDVATMTIEKLKLNIEILNDRRKKAIEPFLNEYLDEQDFLKFVDGYIKMNSDDTFNEFWTTIDYMFGDCLKSPHFDGSQHLQ